MLDRTRPFHMSHGPGLGPVLLGKVAGERGAEVDEVLVDGFVLVGGRGCGNGQGAELGDRVGS